jgi:hypothetical protein
MKTWWLFLISRSSSDSATTGFGSSGYQSCGARFAVIDVPPPAAEQPLAGADAEAGYASSSPCIVSAPS